MAWPNPEMIEQPQSPRYIEDLDYVKAERRYKVKQRYTRDQLFEGEFLPDTFAVDADTQARYISYRYESEIGFPVLVLTFLRRAERTAQYRYHGGTYEAPLETQASYRQKWKYTLYSSTAGAALPAWYPGAVDDSDTADDETYYWSRTGIVGDYKYLVDGGNAGLKVGVINYLEGTATVTKTKVYGTVALANAWSGYKGMLMAPSKTFGESTNDEDWLVRDVRNVDDNTDSVVTVEFILAPGGWDTEIYDPTGVADDA